MPTTTNCYQLYCISLYIIVFHQTYSVHFRQNIAEFITQQNIPNGGKPLLQAFTPSIHYINPLSAGAIFSGLWVRSQAHSKQVTSQLQGYPIYPRNTGPKVRIHPGWNNNPLQGNCISIRHNIHFVG